MRKKDLKLGEIYGGKYGKPYLLVSARMWSVGRYRPEWNLLPARVTTPVRGTVYNDGCGALVIEGDYDALRAYAQASPLLKTFGEIDKGELTLEASGLATELQRDIRVYIREKDVSLRLDLGDYRQWKGTFAEVEEKRAEESARRRRDEEAVQALAAPKIARADEMQHRTRALLGQAEPFAPSRWEPGTCQVGSERRAYRNVLKLTMDELEQLVALAENGPRRGDATEAWLRRHRAAAVPDSGTWHILDGMLDEYRLSADEGRGLNDVGLTDPTGEFITE